MVARAGRGDVPVVVPAMAVVMAAIAVATLGNAGSASASYTPVILMHGPFSFLISLFIC